MLSAPPSAAPLDLEGFKQLRLRPDVWQLGVVRLPCWPDDDSHLECQVWSVVCHSEAAGLWVRSEWSTLAEEAVSTALATVLKLATRPGVHSRPSFIEVCDPEIATALRTYLAGCGIQIDLVDRLDAIDSALVVLSRREKGRRRYWRRFDPSVPDGHVRPFVQAADELFRAAPWNVLGKTDLVRVEGPDVLEGFDYFTVPMPLPYSRGLVFFSSREDYRRFRNSIHPNPFEPPTRLWAMLFTRKSDWPMCDVARFEKCGARPANFRAYPSLGPHPESRVDQSAGPEQFAFAEAVMRALAATNESELDSGRWTKVVDTVAGPRTICLSLPDLLDASEPPTPADAVGEHPESPSLLSARELADRLLTRARGATGRMAIKLARQALQVRPEYTEAWIFLAEESRDPNAPIEMYRNAVSAVERALGHQPPAQVPVHLLTDADAQLYSCVRDKLILELLEDDRDAEADELLSRYPADATAVIAYSSVLVEFRRNGPGPEARARLELALNRNAFVPKELVSCPHSSLPSCTRTEPGSELEALLAAEAIDYSWSATDGAVEWLAAELGIDPLGRP